MSSALDTKFSFLASHSGPGNRKGHNADWTKPFQSTNLVRSKSMSTMTIPAGYSIQLGNRLGVRSYTDLNSIYNARLDVPPPCAAPRKKPAERGIRVEEMPLVAERLKPETLPPAGFLKPRLRGKRLCTDNINALSHVDTLVFGRDVDGSDGCRAMSHAPMYLGAAGLNAKFERTASWGDLPPVCKRTFGEDSGLGDSGWESIQYTRRDPRINDPKT